MFKNQTYNLKINNKHDDLSPDCPTFKRIIQEKKKKAGLREDKQQLQTNKKKKLILPTNAQSLMAHTDEIHHQIMKKINAMIVALSETRMTINIEDCKVNILSYSIHKYDAGS